MFGIPKILWIDFGPGVLILIEYALGYLHHTLIGVHHHPIMRNRIIHRPTQPRTQFSPHLIARDNTVQPLKEHPLRILLKHQPKHLLEYIQVFYLHRCVVFDLSVEVFLVFYATEVSVDTLFEVHVGFELLLVGGEVA